MKYKSIFLLIIVLIAIIVFSPFLTIWSLNTLFSTGIPYTFWTWAAILWLQGMLGIVFSNGKK